MTEPDYERIVRGLRAQLVVKEREAGDLVDRVQHLERRLADAEARLRSMSATSNVTASAVGDSSLIETDDRLVLQEVGIYTYHHPLENSAEYREELLALQGEIKEMVKTKSAIVATDRFSFNNSLAKGRKMTADLSTLMLRAYNAEADICVRTIRAGNLATGVRRLEKAAESIAKLGSMMELSVAPEYQDLRIQELTLTADFMMKVQEEKEEQRAERERLREERRVEKELEAQREKLDKERAHYANVLASLDAGDGDEEGRQRVVAKLADLDRAIEENDYRAANVRAGYVYVISNRGAFGPNVVKIGMTRRLEPMDRVRELGDASVPFPFDVHALYFSEDAVGLESRLHAAFDRRRLNHANLRREFFFATAADVREVLAAEVGSLLEYVEKPEATQYFQSRGSWPADLAPQPIGD